MTSNKVIFEKTPKKQENEKTAATKKTTNSLHKIQKAKFLC